VKGQAGAVRAKPRRIKGTPLAVLPALTVECAGCQWAGAIHGAPGSAVEATRRLCADYRQP